MKIPSQLPQFEKSPTLLIVTGREEAEILFASDGQINEIKRLKTSHPRYTDREGFFKTRARGGMVTRAGAYYDLSRMEKETTEKFYRQLFTELSELGRKYPKADYCLFAPGNELARLRKALEQGQSNKIKRTFRGNYAKAHPLELLKIMDARRERRLTARKLIPTKAKKLLS